MIHKRSPIPERTPPTAIATRQGRGTRLLPKMSPSRPAIGVAIAIVIRVIVRIQTATAGELPTRAAICGNTGDSRRRMIVADSVAMVSAATARACDP
jgi:hypothetical protein